MCTQPSPSVAKRGPLEQNSADLGRCISVHCELYDEKECNEIFGCFWCNREADGSLLEEPKCMSDRQCYDGVMGQENPFLLPEVPRRKTKEVRMLNKMLLIIAGSGAGGLLIIILIVVVCCMRKKKSQYEQEPMSFQAIDMLMDPTAVMDANQGFNQMSLSYPGQSTAVQSTMALNYPGQSTVKQSKMMGNYQGKGAGRQSKMALNYPGQSTKQAPMQMNYPGQSTVMASKMQMRLGGQGLGYPTQAMSGVWSTKYGQSQVMSFAPQQSAMQTPQVPGGGQSTARRRRPRPNRHVSFSEDARGGKKQELLPTSGGEPKVTNENGDL